MTVCRTREQGVAVIMVMLVLAIVAITTAALVKRHQFNQAMTSQIIHLGQAKAHIQGAEHWAHLLLQQDQRNNNTDHLGEAWAQIVLPMPVEQGFVSGQIVDLQSKFNLNNLVKGDETNGASLAVFQRLLDHLELNPQLSTHLIDWLDSNLETGQGTLEDAYYLNLPAPYRSANQRLLDVSELALVRGFDANAVNQLKPFVAALASTSKINVNSAKEPLLIALSESISQIKAQRLVSLRKLNYWRSVNEFAEAALGPKAENNEAQWDELVQGISVSSHYFRLSINAQFGVAITRLESKVHRKDNGIVTVNSRIYTP
jgi:general secretion pathway protein K